MVFECGMVLLVAVRTAVTRWQPPVPCGMTKAGPWPQEGARCRCLDQLGIDDASRGPDAGRPTSRGALPAPDWLSYSSAAFGAFVDDARLSDEGCAKHHTAVGPV
ncbi:MAG: hypothetical protein ACRDUW_06740 [Pseudonocardiaceae bacterium]